MTSASQHVHHCKRVAAVVAAVAATAVVAFAVGVGVLAVVGKWNKVQSVAFFSPRLPFLSFSPGALSCLAHFLRGPSGCSPHSSTVSRRPQLWSVVDSDPPCVVPPCDVSV